jgi:hypothetical protein
MEMYRQITANNIALKEYPFLKELAMEAYLLENEEILRLDSENFNEVTILDAEIALKGGRKTANRDGRIDILAKYGLDCLAIIELKIGEVNLETLQQLEDYLQEREQLVEKYPAYWEEQDRRPQWAGVLVGSSISPELQQKLQAGYKTESGIPIAGMVIRRFRGQGNDIYVIADTYFKYSYSNRDYSKFEFMGQSYNKAKLVHAVLKHYIEKHPNITFAELEQKFPARIQGTNSGVFASKEKAVELFERTGHKRYYIKPEELIALSDATIAVCTQWRPDNLEVFIAHALKMGLKVINA